MPDNEKIAPSEKKPLIGDQNPPEELPERDKPSDAEDDPIEENPGIVDWFGRFFSRLRPDAPITRSLPVAALIFTGMMFTFVIGMLGLTLLDAQINSDRIEALIESGSFVPEQSLALADIPIVRNCTLAAIVTVPIFAIVYILARPRSDVISSVRTASMTLVTAIAAVAFFTSTPDSIGLIVSDTKIAAVEFAKTPEQFRDIAVRDYWHVQLVRYGPLIIVLAAAIFVYWLSTKLTIRLREIEAELLVSGVRERKSTTI